MPSGSHTDGVTLSRTVRDLVGSLDRRLRPGGPRWTFGRRSPGTAGRVEVRLLPFVPTFGRYLNRTPTNDPPGGV